MTSDSDLDGYCEGPLTPDNRGVYMNEQRSHDAGVVHGRWIERQTVANKLRARGATQLADLLENGEL